MRGKVLHQVPLRISLGDHPRLCGEKYNVRKIVAAGGGSPPPMRGKEEMGGGKVGGGRITPAYAGKSDNVET